MLLSVIIPAYNVEPYVQACLDSVFALPLDEDDMEVLVIDDGSTDRTPQLLEKYAVGHNNLRIFRQENQGQSVARNLGIEHATGKYIYFVDADDALTQPCPLPFEAIRSGVYDIIGVETLFNCGGQVSRYCRQTFPFDQEYATCKEYLSTHNVLGLVYGYLFRTSFIQQQEPLRFTPGIYHQDEEFVVKAFCLGGKFVFKKGYTYIYFKRKGSSIHTPTQERQQKLMNHTLIVLQRLKDFATERNLADIVRCKMGWMTLDVFRLLVRQRHTLRFSLSTIRSLASMGMINVFFRTLPHFIRYRYD